MTTVASPPSAPAPRPRPQRRGRYIVAIGGCVVAVVAIIVLAVVLSENVVYFRTVTEAVNNRKDEGTSRFRLAGGVVDRLDRLHDERRELRGDRRQEHRRRPPRRRHARPCSRTARRSWWRVIGRRRRSDAPFLSDRILIKHGADYTPPKVDTKKAAGQ